MQLSQSDIQRIRPYLSELITSDYSVALGITPKMSGLLQTCVNELPCDIDSLYELAKQSKTYMQQKLGMSDHERKFREMAE